jgi:uncharacterized protein (DUF427 family)
MAPPITPSDRHVRASWHGEVIADSAATILVEGNHYFPPQDVRREHLSDSEEHTECPWKGRASYYDVIVAGERNPGAAWTYPEPKEAAEQIRDYIAFWRGVKVEPAG